MLVLLAGLRPLGRGSITRSACSSLPVKIARALIKIESSKKVTDSRAMGENDKSLNDDRVATVIDRSTVVSDSITLEYHTFFGVGYILYVG